MPELLYRDETHQLIGFCMEIHRELGKGRDEVIYKDALVVELSRANIAFTGEKPYQVQYKNVILPHTCQADFVIWNKILFEVKAVEKLTDAHVKHPELSRSLQAAAWSAGQLRQRFAGVEARHFVNSC